jgi:hypothetical protein
MSTIKVDTVRPVTADASLTLQGDNSGTGVSGITIDSSGNATFAGTGNNLGTVTAGTIGSGVVFPTGHMLRQFYDEYDFNGTPVSVSTTASNWSGLQIDITNPSTSNYLFLQMFIPDVYAASSNRGLYGGFVYSTDSFSTETTLGTRSFYHAWHTYSAASYILTNSTLLVRVIHPTSSNYSIRPYFKANNTAVNIGGTSQAADSAVATLFAMEIKG